MNEGTLVNISLKVLETSYVTHDVKRFVLEKPLDFIFVPGQSANISVNAPGWSDVLRPFTFTSVPEDNYLEFMIKIYRNRNGMTERLEMVNEGDELIIHDVFGTIKYQVSGIFIAAGTGITPFISIFRHLFRTGQIRNNLLIYSNKTIDDVILNDELEKMLGDNMIRTFTRENVIGFIDRRIDRDFLIDHIEDFKQQFYICGPDGFVNDINNLLKSLGASSEFIIV